MNVVKGSDRSAGGESSPKRKPGPGKRARSVGSSEAPAAASRSTPPRGTISARGRRPLRVLAVSNRQRTQRIARANLRKLLVWMLTDALGVEQFELGVHLVAAPEMTAVNERYLQHDGSTDVITFNHAEGHSPTALHGELFVCVDEAVALARRFRTTWPEEVLRYCVHGCLHLQGHDDTAPAARRLMKRVENRVMRALRNRFAPATIAPNMRSVT